MINEVLLSPDIIILKTFMQKPTASGDSVPKALASGGLRPRVPLKGFSSRSHWETFVPDGPSSRAPLCLLVSKTFAGF